MGKKTERIMKGVTKLTFKEEIANTVSHGVMAILVVFLLPFASTYSYTQYDLLRCIGVSIFIICLFLMFLCSTLYHCMDYHSTHKAIFRILDHICIYLAIAGSYTPVALSLIQGLNGIIILVIQWSMVLIGIIYKSIATNALPKLSLSIYIIMGWTAIFFLPALFRNASFLFLLFILLGGIFYSIGAYFFTRKNLAYAHFIWHLFINLASISHIVAILFLM